MKKFLVTILALVYLSTSIGAVVQFHYCMDKLVAWNLGKQKTNEKSCGYCGMADMQGDTHYDSQSEGCCKNEQKLFKIEKDQKVSEPGLKLSKLTVQLPIHWPIQMKVVHMISPSIEYPLTHAPPGIENVSLYVRNCLFRI